MTTAERPRPGGGTKQRATRQQSAVLGVLDGADDFLSAQELHSRLRGAGQGVGLSTVYRTLQALAGAGEVDVLLSPEGEARYRSCSTGHHHHLVCRRCGRTVEVRSAAVERWAATVAAEQGFSEVSHTIEVFGLCPDCTRARTAARVAPIGPEPTPGP